MTGSWRLARMGSPASRASRTPVIARQASSDTPYSVGRPGTRLPDSGPSLASPQAQASRSSAPRAQPTAIRSPAGADAPHQGAGLGLGAG
jgi:hypothetical protein